MYFISVNHTIAVTDCWLNSIVGNIVYWFEKEGACLLKGKSQKEKLTKHFGEKFIYYAEQNISIICHE